MAYSQFVDILEKKAFYLRKRIIKLCVSSGAGHITSSLSILDILVALYLGNILRYDSNDPAMQNRDRLIPKGHSTLALYSVLAEAGFFKKEDVNTFCQKGTIFGGLATTSVPGIECHTGSLGHGLPFAVGMALSAKMKNEDHLIYVIVGDGECQEGTTWEAAMAIAQFNLTNLIWIIDRNRMQLSGTTSNVMELEPLDKKIQSFGINTTVIDGHNYNEIFDALSVDRKNLPAKPMAIIANTIKGKGVPFLENKLKWHARKPDKDELEIILEQLDVTKMEFEQL
jgi:transketolase